MGACDDDYCEYIKAMMRASIENSQASRVSRLRTNLFGPAGAQRICSR
jgi:hypothetical protein